MVTYEDVLEARKVLRGVAKHTPLKTSRSFSQMTGANVVLKAENLQTTGSFKIRGAYNKIHHLSDAEKKAGVVCSSAGNHAQGVAYSASALGLNSTVFMPIFAPPTKVLATRGYGATVVLEGESYDEAYKAAREFADANGSTFVHPFNDDRVIAGQGTIGLEIHEDFPKANCVFVPVGGGGLVSGVAIAMKRLNPDIEIIGVEAGGAPSMKQSLEQGRIIPLSSIATIADGIAVKTPGDKTFALVREHVDRVVTVDDEQIAAALYLLLQRSKLVVEPAGATSLAAILAAGEDVRGRNAVALLSGGNVDLAMLTQIIDRGMLRECLMARLVVTIPDKPGFLRDILGVLSDLRANVSSIEHDRTATAVPVGHVNVTITFQTLGSEQVEAIEKEMCSRGMACRRLR
jgi:threonine dehydratase